MSVFGNPFSYYRDPREEQRAVDALAARGRPAPGPDASSIAAAIGALAGQRSQPAPQAPAAPQEPDPVHLTALNALRAAAPPPPPEPEAEPEPEPVDHSGAYGALTAAAPRPPDILPEPEPVDESPAFAGLAQAGRNRIPAPLPLKPVPIPVGLRGRVSTPDMDLSEDPEALALTSPTPRHVDYPGEVVVTASDAGRMHPSVSGKDFDGSDAGEGSVKNPLPGMDLEKDPNPPGKPAAQKEPKDPDQPSTTSVNGTPAQQRQESSDSAPDEPAPPGVNGWALAADILLNNGQGVNGIIGQANQQKAAWQANKRAGVDDQFKRDQHAVAADNARLRGEELQQTISKSKTDEDRRLHPEKYPLTPEQQIAKDREAREGKKTEHDTDMGDWEKSERNKLDYAKIEADKATAAANADERRVDNARADRGLNIQERNATAAADRFSKSEDHRVKREETTDHKTAATDSRQFNKDTNFQREMALELDKIDKVAAAYGGTEADLPGQGLIEGLIPDKVHGIASSMGIDKSKHDDAIAINNAKSRLQEYALRKDTGANAPENEQRRSAMMNGSKPGASKAEFLGGINAAKDLVSSDMRSLATGREDAARASLEAGGLSHWLGGDGPKPSAPGSGFAPKPVPMGKQSALAPAVPGELGAPKRAGAPDNFDAAAGDLVKGKPVKLTVRNAAGETQPLTIHSDDEWADFEAANPGWSIVE